MFIFRSHGTRCALALLALLAATAGTAQAANLEVRINGTTIGSSFSPSADGVWKNFSFTWSSGSSSSALLQIVDLNINGYGNDPCLDDLSFSTASAVSVPSALNYGLAALCVGMAAVVVKRLRGNPTTIQIFLNFGHFYSRQASSMQKFLTYAKIGTFGT